MAARVPWGEGVHRVLLCEAIGRPLVRACHRGIREFCLSRGARVFMRQARRRSCSPCCRPALREPGCRTLLQIARAVVGLDRTGMPSCPGAANETSPPHCVRTSFSGVFPIKRAGEASGSEQEKLQPACLFPEASGSEGPPLVAGIHGSSPALVTRARRHDQWPRVFHGVKGCTGCSYARR
jgi:hypothetical protein